MFEKYLEFKESKRGYNMSFFDGFLEMLEKYGLDQETINLAIQLIIDERGEYSLGGSQRNLLSNNKYGKNCVENFFSYLYQMGDKLGPEDMKNFLTTSIHNISQNMDAYEGMNRSKPTNFINLFLREIVISFPQDVKLEIWGTPMKDISPDSLAGNIEATIGGVSLGHLHFEEAVSNIKNIQFTDFRTLPGLERLGLGSYMFSEFCRQLETDKPGYTATAYNVMRGKDGEKTYSKWGAYPTNSYMVENYDFYFDEKPLTPEEYEAWGDHSMLYYFNQETIHNLAERESPTYGVDDDIEEIE